MSQNDQKLPSAQENLLAPDAVPNEPHDLRLDQDAAHGEQVQSYAFGVSEEVVALQAVVAERFGCDLHPPLPGETLGVSRNTRDGIWPLNGLRHPAAGETCGWYIWAGDQLPADEHFFLPLHVEHLGEWSPAAVKYLALPPGSRFLIAPGYEDVWYDSTLLD